MAFEKVVLVTYVTVKDVLDVTALALLVHRSDVGAC